MWTVEKIVKKGDYLYAKVKGHPNATKNGYVLHHRIVMENHIGRLLTKNEVVHHKNEEKHDNRIENLEITDPSSHASEHGRAKGRKYVKLRCPQCGDFFEKPLNASFLQKGGKWSACSPSCRGKFSRKIQLEGLTTDVEKAIGDNLLSIYVKSASEDKK